MFKIGMAVSGGADSTALLVLLARLRETMGFEAAVLHVDHSLRPDSAADAEFVRALAARFGLPFHGVRVKVRRRKGESIEMAARRVRLAFFARMTRELELDAVATGHHADDVAETFLMRLARGSGPDGLAGLKRISRVDGITFIRPLLDLRDRDLCAFLVREGIAWREDSTNHDVSILRNKVRRVVIPWLRENLDARITEHVCKTAAILRGDCEKPKAASKTKAKREPSAKFTMKIEPSRGFERRVQKFGEWPATCEMSRAALAGRKLEIRGWRAGDRIAPIGMGGKSRKLQDVFVTAKVAPALRAALPLVADAESGEVLWVPGYRAAEGVAVESADAPSWRFTLSTRSRISRASSSGGSAADSGTPIRPAQARNIAVRT